MNNIKTTVEKAIAEFGTNNIFLVSEDYHGRYHDDYCTFTYYNAITDEFFTDEWTTAFCCPSYNSYMTTKIATAVKDGLLNTEQWLNKVRTMATWKQDTPWVPTIVSLWEEVAKFGLRVKVEGGRKWKGTGYWVGTKVKSFQYATPMFRTNDSSFGRSTTVLAKIFDPITSRIEYVNLKYVQVLAEENLRTDFIKMHNDIIANSKLEDIHYFSNKLPKISGNHETYAEFIKNNTPSVDWSMAYDEVEFEEKKRAAEFREKKMKDLIEWVTNNTDKTGDDILKLAEHIFNKKYAQ